MKAKYGGVFMLLVSDLDTILKECENSDNKTVDRLYTFMKNDLFMVCTDRNVLEAIKKLEKYDIPVDYISTGNGSHLFDRNLNCLEQKCFSTSFIRELEPLNQEPFVSNISYHAAWEYPNRKVGMREVSSIQASFKKRDFDSSYLDIWEKYFSSNASIVSKKVQDDIVSYVVKPKNISRKTSIKYLEKNVPLLRKEVLIDPRGFDSLDEFEEYQIIPIHEENTLEDSNSYSSLSEFLKDYSKYNRQKRR